MTNKLKMMLGLLLIVQKTAGWTTRPGTTRPSWATRPWRTTRRSWNTPSMACDSNCGNCNCRGRGLTSVPQYLPTDITGLDLSYNNITTLSQSDFSRYSSLTYLYLNNNNIDSIDADVFLNLPQLRFLSLNHNSITTLSLTAYDTLVSIGSRGYVNIRDNPWQCDCSMLPVKHAMTGAQNFDDQMICAGPANIAGKSLLHIVKPEDLNCEETGTSALPGSVNGTSLGFSLPSFLSGLLGVIVGVLLILTVLSVIWCTKGNGKTIPASIPDPIPAPAPTPDTQAAGP